jgi:hypothetical protein
MSSVGKRIGTVLSKEALHTAGTGVRRCLYQEGAYMPSGRGGGPDTRSVG